MTGLPWADKPMVERANPTIRSRHFFVRILLKIAVLVVLVVLVVLAVLKVRREGHVVTTAGLRIEDVAVERVSTPLGRDGG